MWFSVAAVLAGLVVLGFLALSIKPRPFPMYPERTTALKTVELPADLPAPVVRY